MSKRLAAILAAVCCALPLRAQFFSYGTEAPSVSWNSFSTGRFRFVYPAGCDSLAFEYAKEWEMTANPVGSTIGYTPNASYRRPLPVILHPFSAYSNGVVVWAPRRMEMYTGAEMYSPDAMPWQRSIAIHESRHACQQQYCREGFFGAVSVVTGEIATGIADVLCYDIAMFEGDAVATETALSQAGRGRNADFLEYFRVCFDEGQMRNYWQWRYGSLDRFTPDFYKIGYLVQAGLRTEFNAPEFMADTYRRLHRKGAKGKLDNFNRCIAETAGMPFPAAYDSIMTAFGARWAASLESRAPFQPRVRITSADRFFEEYTNLVPTPNGIFAVRSGIASASELVRLEGNTVESVCAFRSGTSPLQYSSASGRIYWTELKPDLRYEMHSSSILKWIKPGERRAHVLAGDGKRSRSHRYFNPSPHSCDSLVAVAETLPDGASAVVVLKESDGSPVECFPAPDGILAVEPVWLQDTLYVVGQSLEGMGIYRAEDYLCVLGPVKAKINHIRGYGARLYFTSDLDSENELYSFDPSNAGVLRITNLPRGGKDFSFAGDSLFFSELKSDGRMICLSATDSLRPQPVDFRLGHIYQDAETLSRQEPLKINETFGFEHPVPEKYSKLCNAVKLHSWLPAWADYDELSSISFESLTTSLAPGATVFFHNDLNTLTGYAGFSYSPVDSLGWSPGAHISLGYYGILPVVKASLDFDRRGLSGTISSYIPLNFSSGGWKRALIPNATFSFSGPKYGYMVGVRAYTMRPIPASCIYPRYGIGMEAGIANNKAYGLLYGYLPGFVKTHGVFASAEYLGFRGSLTAKVKYALPFASVDWNWKDWLYVRNFELYPQYTFLRLSLPSSSLNVHSVGLGADAVFGNIWFVRTPVRLGVQYNYSLGLPGSPHQLSAILSVEI